MAKKYHPQLSLDIHCEFRFCSCAIFFIFDMCCDFYVSGTKWEKIRIQKWYTIYKDHITLEDYEIHDGMGLELYYN